MANLTNTQRIGALVPATNPVVEPDFYRVVPPEITVHFERMWNGTWGSQPEAPADSGHKLAMSSSEANEIDWALFGFDVNKMNDDVARGQAPCPTSAPMCWSTPAPPVHGTRATWPSISGWPKSWKSPAEYSPSPPSPPASPP